MEPRNPRTASRVRALGLLACLTVAALIMVSPGAAGAAPTTPDEGSPGPQTSAAATESASNSPPTDAQSAAPAVAIVGPQLSIGIDNGKTSTTVGENMDYVITVQNLGATDVDGLQVNQTVPVGLSFGTADAGGTAGPGGVSWNLDLKATTTATLHSAMTVTVTPPELLRLASVACASVSPDGIPIVCASHSDQLPAGAAAEAAQAATVEPPATGIQSWQYLLGGLGILAVIGASVTWGIVRQRRRPAADREGELTLTK